MPKNDIAIIRVDEEDLDYESSKSVQKELRATLTQGAKKIALDLSKVRFLNSQALGRVWAFANLCSDHKIAFVVFGLAQPIYEVFQASSYLYHGRQVAKDEQEAIEKLNE